VIVHNHFTANVLNLWQLYLQSRDSQYSPYAWSVEEIEMQIKKENTKYIFLENDKKIVSFIFFLDLKESIEILYLETHPQFFHNGFMKYLLSQALKNWSKYSIWLDVHENNETALKLYFQLGFEKTGHRLNYYKDGGACLQLTLAANEALNS
jgi:ribosomal protein S18 acetylase RimI-like enzyme